MVSKKTLSEAESLEQWRVALENVEKQTKIAELMSELGYDTEIVAEGKALLAETRAVYDFNKTEDDETTEASQAFKVKRMALLTLYKDHRKKAKVIFRKDSIAQQRLGIDHYFSNAYVKQLEMTKKFYQMAGEDADILAKLRRLKINGNAIAAGVALVSGVETARAEYLREKGESQDATKSKDEAMAAMEDWMYEFFAVARIALKDSPQLLEALGKGVKS